MTSNSHRFTSAYIFDEGTAKVHTIHHYQHTSTGLLRDAKSNMDSLAWQHSCVGSA